MLSLLDRAANHSIRFRGNQFILQVATYRNALLSQSSQRHSWTQATGNDIPVCRLLSLRSTLPISTSFHLCTEQQLFSSLSSRLICFAKRQAPLLRRLQCCSNEYRAKPSNRRRSFSPAPRQ